MINMNMYGKYDFRKHLFKVSNEETRTLDVAPVFSLSTLNMYLSTEINLQFTICSPLTHSFQSFYKVKTNNRNNRTICTICSKLTIKTSERCSGVFIVGFEGNLHIALVFSQGQLGMQCKNLVLHLFVAFSNALAKISNTVWGIAESR